MTAQINVKPDALFTRDNMSIFAGMNNECVELVYFDCRSIITDMHNIAPFRFSYQQLPQ